MVAVNIEVGSAGPQETALNRVYWSRSVKVALSRKIALASVVAPADGDVYIVPVADATNHDKIAFWSASSSVWLYLTPKQGWMSYVKDDAEFVSFTGTSWTKSVAKTLDDLSDVNLSVVPAD